MNSPIKLGYSLLLRELTASFPLIMYLLSSNLSQLLLKIVKAEHAVNRTLEISNR